MKRSEMLAELTEILYELPEDLDEAAEEILHRMEMLGMCPVTTGPNGNDLQSLDWEPEDIYAKGMQ